MINKVIYETNGKAVFISNLLFLHGISVYNIKQHDNKCRFSVRKKHSEGTEKVLEQYGKEFTIIKDSSVSNFFKKNIGRFGLYAGIIFLSVFAFLWASVVTEINITGTKLVDKDIIKEKISESYELPIQKKSLNLDILEMKLIEVEGISNVSLQVKGNVLFVDILEKLKQPNLVDYDKKEPIISNYDAVITKVVTLSGTPKVKVGETVKKGDILIAPEKQIDEDTVAEIKALGNIYGRIWLSEKYFLTPTVMKSKRTGKAVSFYSAINSEIKIKSPYKEYEESEEVICNYFFPIKLKKTTFYETIQCEEKFDYLLEKDKLIEEAKTRLESKVPLSAEKVGISISEKTVDKNIILVIYYEIIVDLTEELES